MGRGYGGLVNTSSGRRLGRGYGGLTVSVTYAEQAVSFPEIYCKIYISIFFLSGNGDIFILLWHKRGKIEKLFAENIENKIASIFMHSSVVFFYYEYKLLFFIKQIFRCISTKIDEL